MYISGIPLNFGFNIERNILDNFPFKDIYFSSNVLLLEIVDFTIATMI